MKCPGCNGEVRELKGNLTQILDTQGHCSDCHGALLRDKTMTLAVEFCKCKDVKPEQEIFYFRPNGRHGWLHTVCGQITQTG